MDWKKKLIDLADERANALSAAEQSEKSQQQFFSVMSHDMRTPLNIIIGMTNLALQAAGIEWEYVPGVTSAVAAPGWAGMPVTHRGVSRSVHIAAAHTADTADGLPACLEELARLQGTLVFLMGLSQLEALARRLMEAGVPPEVPAAVISGENAPRPMAVRGTLGDIAGKAREAGAEAPAVIVVGGTAGMDLRA